MLEKDMERYCALISIWMDDEPLSKEEEADLIEALKASKPLRDYWFRLQSVRAVIKGQPLLPNLSRQWSAHDQIAYIHTEIKERKKSQG